MSAGSLFYGDYLVSKGLPCDTNPFGVSQCLVILALFLDWSRFLGHGVHGYFLFENRAA